MMARAIGAGLLILALVGCSAHPSPTTDAAATPTEAATASASLPPPSFDAEAVAAEVAVDIQSECVSPVDELLCSVVQFEWITFENGVLSVPTTLDAEAVEDAEHVCSFFDTANINPGSGALLGIDFIDILGTTGALIASCESEA